MNRPAYLSHSNGAPPKATTAPPGWGLGLAREQAGLLGAQLNVRSQAGAGSTFSITFADPHFPPGTGPGTDPRS